MNGTARIAWSRYTGWCQGCRRRFRITLEALAQNREHLIAAHGQEVSADNSDAELATQFEFCMECSGGCKNTGEFINDNQFALRWDPKGWALVTLERMARATFQLENAVAKGYNRVDERLLRRLARCAFLAEALRARIDGRY